MSTRLPFTRAFKFSELQRQCALEEEEDLRRRCVLEMIWPTPVEAKPVAKNQPLHEYLDRCANNCRAEVFALLSNAIQPNRYSWRQHAFPERYCIQYVTQGSKVTVTSLRPVDVPEGHVELLPMTLVLLDHHIGIVLNDSLSIELGVQIRDPHWRPPPKAGRYAEPKDEPVLWIIGYAGSYVKDLCAALKLKAGNCPRECLEFAQEVSAPEGRLYAAYPPAEPLRTEEMPCNQVQELAIQALHCTVEGIQGPPGTGKSTTIFHIVRSRLPEGHVAIVTCVQNKAVDAIAEKLAKSIEHLPFIAVGSVDRIGDTSALYTLDAQVLRHPEVVSRVAESQRRSAILSLFIKRKNSLLDLLEGDDMKKHSKAAWDKLWKAYILRGRCNDEGDSIENDISIATSQSDESKSELRRVQHAVSLRIAESAKAVLCTIDVASGLLADDVLEAVVGPKPKIAIVDEAGTVPEYKVPLLATLGCRAIVCIGDQNQLRPFTHVTNDVEMDGFFHRLAKQMAFPMLTHQYRMHPTICGFVSATFYDGKLITPPEIAQAREGMGIVWEECTGPECSMGKTGLLNETEAERAFARFQQLAESSSGSVMLCTFYKRQHKLLLEMAKNSGLMMEVQDKRKRKKMVTRNPLARITTVDAAQGSEADVVILSCVRSNAQRKIGFLSNPNRMCVATSRARETLYVFGNSRTLTSDPLWRSLHSAAA